MHKWGVLTKKVASGIKDFGLKTSTSKMGFKVYYPQNMWT